MTTKYCKIRFTSPEHGATGGLVVTERDARHVPVTILSRLFPAYEAPKMERLEVSPGYGTWGEAFNHDFERTPT